MKSDDYQLIIIGGGPAGLTAGLYAARARLKAVLIEKGALGGQVLVTDSIENYPGFPQTVSGFDLIDKMKAQCERFGLETRLGNVVSIDSESEIKTVLLENGEQLKTRSIILCTGARPAKLGIPGETEFIGKGVSYCATCDAPFYRNQDVAVVGGGNTALQEALYLTKFASKVYLIHRRREFRATKIFEEKIIANNRIEFLLDTQVKNIKGDSSGVTQLDIKSSDGSNSKLNVTGIFIFIGTIPNNENLPLDKLETDERGFIVTNSEMETNLPGIFAAGDIRSKNFRQIVNAAGEGAVAELSAENYVDQFD